MKSFFELRESKINEETVELAGATLQNMEHCPGAVSAFKQNLKDGAAEKDVAKAAKAVDAYLAIEDKAKKSGATESDIEKMKGLIDTAKSVISDLGLEGHTYHDMHLNRVKKMVKEAVEPDDTGGEEETEMAMGQVQQMRHFLDGIEKMVKADGDMEEWVQNKLVKATDYLKTIYSYKTGRKDDDMNEAMTASQHRMAMIDKIKKSGAVKSGSMSKNEEKVDEAAPKMQGDWLKKQRERDREHNAAMGRTATGRKKPVRQMTSTQRSLASLRGNK